MFNQTFFCIGIHVGTYYELKYVHTYVLYNTRIREVANYPDYFSFWALDPVVI